jgi:hypothetical protein
MHLVVVKQLANIEKVKTSVVSIKEGAEYRLKIKFKYELENEFNVLWLATCWSLL